MEFKEGIAYVGLRDVVGGKMWFCVEHENTNQVIVFRTKKECGDYARKMFSRGVKKHLLRQLDAIKGRRAYINNKCKI